MRQERDQHKKAHEIALSRKVPMQYLLDIVDQVRQSQKAHEIETLVLILGTVDRALAAQAFLSKSEVGLLHPE